MIAFAGVIGRMGMPTFEFFKVTDGMRVNRIFVRDLQHLWYQRGVRELGDDVATAAAALLALVAASHPTRVVTIGNSGGGYAALLFGALIGADEVLAFSPQTVLGRVEAMRYRESTWLHVTERLEAAGGPDARHADLRPLLAATRPSPSCHIHYARGDGIDTLHAEHLRDVPGVELHPHDHGDHNLIVRLRDEGRLRGLLSTALGIAEVGAVPASRIPPQLGSAAVQIGVKLRPRARRASRPRSPEGR